MNDENPNPNELIDSKKQEEPVNVNTNEQQVNQNPQNNKESKKVDKNKLIIIGVIIVVLLVIAISVNLMNKNDQKLEENTSTETNNDYEEDNYIDDTLDIEEKEDSDEVDEETDEIELKENEELITKGCDNYYIKKVDNKDYYLMRNEKEVAKLEEDNKFKLYKDESDKNSKYTAVRYHNNNFYFGSFMENSEYAYLNVEVDEKNFVWNSILYNINTGNNKTFDGAIITIYRRSINGYLTNYFVLSGKDNESLIDAKKMKIVSDKTKYTEISGDYGIYGGFPGCVATYGEYIIVRNKNKDDYLYGLIDFKGNLVIDTIYDSMITVDTNNIILVKKGNKFGAIDSNGKVIIDFEYDGIAYVDGYFIVSKNNKLGVINQNKEEIVPFNIDLEHVVDYELRPQDGEGFFGDFYAAKKDDKIVIEYFPKGKTSKNGYKGHDIYYLVVSKDSSYKVYEDYKLY